MVNLNTIKTAWAGLVGYLQSKNPATLITDYYSASSGLYINDAHGLVNHEVLKAINFEETEYSYPAYDNSTAYVIGQIVSNGGSDFIAIANGTGNATSDTDYWKPYDAYTEVLGDYIRKGITDVVQDWANIRGEEYLLEEVKETGTLIRSSIRNAIEDTSRAELRGIRINPNRSEFLKIKIHRVGFSFKETWDFDLYLFHTGLQEPEKSKSISYPGTGQVVKNQVWYEVDDWILDGDGSYFIGYQRSTDDPNSLNTLESNIYVDELSEGFSKCMWMAAYGFYIDGTNSALWDINQTTEVSDTNFGINIEYSIYCDFTDIFIRHKGQFALPLQKAVALRILKDAKLNPRARENRHLQNMSALELDYEINGDPSGRPTGLYYEYRRALKNVALSFGEDLFCLPCSERGIEIQKQ